MGETGKASSTGIFRDGLHSVQAAAAFLSGRHRGQGIAEQGKCQELAQHVHRQLTTLAAERPSRLRVLVLGEFKAGKSSLINTLVGKQVAAADVGELTASVCRIVPIESGPEFARMYSEAGKPVREMSVPEFVAATKAHGIRVRSGEASPLDSYVRADVYVRTLLPVELVDTPGLGAARKNETAAMDALAQADLILLTVDSDNVGGARDAAVLERIQASGQTVIVAVTKTDLLEGDEQDEVVDFVIRTYGVSREMVFPVSAKRAEAKGKEEGVERLTQFLTDAAPHRASWRDGALLSQVCDLSVEVAAGLAMVEAALEEALDDVQENQKALLETARIVTEDICHSVASTIRQKLQTEAEGILLGYLHNRAAPFTEQELISAYEQSIQNMDSALFWESLKVSLATQFQKEWSEGIRRQLELLNANLDQQRKEMRTETSALSDRLAQEQIARLERKNHAVGNAVGAGLAAVAMLATGFPLLPVVVVALPAVWSYYAHKLDSQQEATMDEITSAVRATVSAWVDDYVQSIMVNFEKKLLEENRIVAHRAADGYGCQRTEFSGTVGELRALLKTVRQHLAAMSELTAGSRLLPADA